MAWNAWGPLAKLTYSCYLVHMLVVGWINSLPQYNVMLSQVYMVYLSLANIMVSMGLAFGMVLMFEAPLTHMEKLLFGFLGITKLPLPVSKRT